MQDRVSLHPGRVKLVPVAGQENTYDMVRADSPTQEGTPLNKDSLLKDATAALYGLPNTAVPDDALALLGPYVQYWWRATGKGYVEYRAPAAQVTLTMSLAVQPIYYSNNLSVDFATGEINLINPQTVNADYNSTSTLTVLRGKYFTNIKNAPNNIYFAAQDAAVTTEKSDGSYFVFLSNCSRVTSMLKEGTSTYLRSADRNAYPDSGIVDGIEYQFLGRPLDNAVGSPQIETGSYVGTGTYGSDNPCSLIFESIPKFVYIKSFDSSHAGFFLPFTLTDSFTWFAYQGFTENAGLQSANLSAKFKNLTLSWYSAGAYTDAKYQLNTSEKKYCYIAII